MLTIEVVNFRGCAEARVECAPIALLAGRNAAGKSSIAQAVAAALTGEMVPAGLARNQVGALIRSGAANAEVRIVDEAGSVSAHWPAAQLSSEGDPARSSVYAAGVRSIVDREFSAKDRMRVLAEYLKAAPTRHDLAEALDSVGFELTEEQVDRLWQTIELNGWDATHDARRTRGAEMKGQWRQITGANYGSRIAASWRSDLADADERALQAAVERAQADRDHAISTRAVSAAERNRVEQEAGHVLARTGLVRQAEARVAECTAAYQHAQEVRSALPPSAGRVHLLKCPHCDRQVELVQDLTGAHLEIPEDDGSDSLRERRMAIATADGNLSNTNGQLNQARGTLAHEQELLRAATEASERLANWPSDADTGVDIEAAVAALERASKQLADVRIKTEADTLHQKIEDNELVIAILAGDGLRARKLALVVKVFSGRLTELGKVADWAPVAIGDDGAVTYGGRPYALLSSSEQFRVRAVLAVDMARLDESDLVVIDGADILDVPARNGLFALLEHAGASALVCMTLSRRELMPDLAGAKLGRSYWIDGGAVAAGERAAA